LGERDGAGLAGLAGEHDHFSIEIEQNSGSLAGRNLNAVSGVEVFRVAGIQASAKNGFTVGYDVYVGRPRRLYFQGESSRSGIAS
jgi:hypothetical protein